MQTEAGLARRAHESQYGKGLPEIRDWKWGLAKAGTPARKRPARRG
jgi:hypothetical protein